MALSVLISLGRHHCHHRSHQDLERFRCIESGGVAYHHISSDLQLYASSCPWKSWSSNHHIAFLMISAKLSDIWGVKTILLSSNAIFFVFSMTCGGSKSMTQLYVLYTKTHQRSG
jgi:hypothetical protein